MNMMGYLVKKGGGIWGRRFSFKLRWFELWSDRFVYYKSRGAKKHIRVVPLEGRSVRIVNKDTFNFAILPEQLKGRTFQLFASDKQSMVQWVAAFQAVCDVSESQNKLPLASFYTSKGSKHRRQRSREAPF
jgi:hypothetical protein